ncbi:MAG: hypothetical protein MUO91_04110 [candidate division Zixibacteria bacterium]|nr:hypothetical protein [candidate division Zixibacteria bacterium]
MHLKTSHSYLRFWVPLILVLLLFGVLTAASDKKAIRFKELPVPGEISTLSILSPTRDTIFYDNDTALYVITNSNTWVGVRFTPLHHFDLETIYFGILNQYNNTTNGCSLYVVADNGAGRPNWPSGKLAGFWVAPPVPDRVWIQVDLSSPIRFSANENFHIIYGPAPGGAYPGPGWWGLLDSDSTTTQRSYVSLDNRVNWLTITFADAFIRAGGVYFTTPPDFFLSAVAGSYAPWGMAQALAITSDGHVYFFQSELDSPDVDSIFALLAPLELRAIYDTVMAVGFFSLDTLYDSGEVDGSGILLHITASGTEHAVQAKNIAVPEVNRIVWTLNAILQPFGIELDYGELTGKEGR